MAVLEMRSDCMIGVQILISVNFRGKLYADSYIYENTTVHVVVEIRYVYCVLVLGFRTLKISF